MEKATWDLSPLYESFSSEDFQKDLRLLPEQIQAFNVWCQENLNIEKNDPNAAEKLTAYITYCNNLGLLQSRLMEFCELTLSTDTTNEQALIYLEKLEDASTHLTKSEVLFSKWVCAQNNVDTLCLSTDFLKDHQFFVEETIKTGSHMLSDKEEALLAKLKTTGSLAWTKLQETLTSTMEIVLPQDGKTYPLPAIRNMAYNADAAIRKAAYEAELHAYGHVSYSVCAALNAIKGEVLTECELRGYSSVLEKTLADSRMSQKALDSMLLAIKKSLGAFEAYFLKKAELLGHKDGLPFYDLFAPIGKMEKTYTYEQAQDIVIEHFTSFSPKLGQYAKNAFRNRWIDVYPRQKKRGGAFCSNLHCIGESRILTNFTGSLSDVITLAHELGHGYHGHCLKESTYLNSDYPMPIAETASTFCETIVKKGILKTASDSEKVFLIENDLCDHAQVIVDIYSRYLFEHSVFEKREEGPLSVASLCEMMLQAQKEAYGKGLKENEKHPYMWLCKPHYYDADYNYYNFPYAFGLLFALGLYEKYQTDKDSFPDKYDKLLSATGSASLNQVAAIAGIDIEEEGFFSSGLHAITQEIEQFLSLIE